MPDSLQTRLHRHALFLEGDGKLGSLPTADLLREAAEAQRYAEEALELFIEAEHGHGWSEMKTDTIERLAYDNAHGLLAKLKGAA